MPMSVVTDGTLCGQPIYVGRNEIDARMFLDTLELDLRSQGKKVERPNSLKLRVTGNDYRTYETFICPSWEDAISPVSAKATGK